MIDRKSVNKALTNNYLLVEASFSAWSARKTAKEVAREAEFSHNAVEGSVSAGVRLLAGVDSLHKEVVSAQGKIRSYVYDSTLPFGAAQGPTKKGPRLLPVAKTMTFMAEVKKLMTAYETALDRFLAEYPHLRLVALNNIRTLGQIEDYPEPEKMPGRFSAKVTYLPVPEIGNFKNVQLPPDILDNLAQDMAQTQQSALKAGFEDLRGRIAAELNRTITQLTKLKEGERTSIFKSMQTSVQNLAELLEATIPVFGEDQKLVELHAKLAELGKINPESYKKTEKARLQGEALALEATEILAKIEEEASSGGDQKASEPPPEQTPIVSAPQAPKAPSAPPVPSASTKDLDDALAELDAVL